MKFTKNNAKKKGFLRSHEVKPRLLQQKKSVIDEHEIDTVLETVFAESRDSFEDFACVTSVYAMKQVYEEIWKLMGEIKITDTTTLPKHIKRRLAQLDAWLNRIKHDVTESPMKE